jgi:hypothetical protein
VVLQGFEAYRRTVAEGGVSTMRIVPAFDVAEDGEPGLDVSALLQ